MKFEIILYEDANAKSINWHIASEYSICCSIPLSYFTDAEKSLQINNDLVRTEAASIHEFLVDLNKAYYKTHKFKSICINYHEKSENKSITILDSFL